MPRGESPSAFSAISEPMEPSAVGPWLLGEPGADIFTSESLEC